MSEQQSGRPDKRWSTEDIDQPWNIGEAIGVAMRRLFPYFASLVLPLVGVELFYLALSSAVGVAFARVPSVALFVQSLTSRPSAFMPPAPPPVPLLAAWGGSVLFCALLTSALAMAKGPQ